MKNLMLSKIQVFVYIISFSVLVISCGNKSVNTNSTDDTSETKVDSLSEIYIKKVISTHPNGNDAKVQYYDKSDVNDIRYQIKYHENGVKEMEGAYLDFKRNGKWIAWYDNGVVWSIGYYSNGLKNGASEVFYANGQTRYEKNYVNDTAEGEWMFFDENGTPIGKAIYKKGVLIDEIAF